MPKTDGIIRVEIVEISCSDFARWLAKGNKRLMPLVTDL
jgi:hypothetical protein